MDARRRAAHVAAEVHRSRATVAAARGKRFNELGVYVKNTEVRTNGLTWNSSRHLGSLVDACAGVMDIRPVSAGQIVSAVVIGNAPRVGTVFVAFADGTRHEKSLRQGSRMQMYRVDQAIALFNAMADAASR